MNVASLLSNDTNTRRPTSSSQPPPIPPPTPPLPPTTTYYPSHSPRHHLEQPPFGYSPTNHKHRRSYGEKGGSILSFGHDTLPPPPVKGHLAPAHDIHRSPPSSRPPKRPLNDSQEEYRHRPFDELRSDRDRPPTAPGLRQSNNQLQGPTPNHRPPPAYPRPNSAMSNPYPPPPNTTGAPYPPYQQSYHPNSYPQNYNTKEQSSPYHHHQNANPSHDQRRDHHGHPNTLPPMMSGPPQSQPPPPPSGPMSIHSMTSAPAPSPSHHHHHHVHSHPTHVHPHHHHHHHHQPQKHEQAGPPVPQSLPPPPPTSGRYAPSSAASYGPAYPQPPQYQQPPPASSYSQQSPYPPAYGHQGPTSSHGPPPPSTGHYGGPYGHPPPPPHHHQSQHLGPPQGQNQSYSHHAPPTVAPHLAAANPHSRVSSPAPPVHHHHPPPHHHHHHHHHLSQQAQTLPPSIPSQVASVVRESHVFQPRSTSPTPSQIQLTESILTKFAKDLEPKAIKRLPDLGTFVYPNLPLPLKRGLPNAGQITLDPSNSKGTPNVREDEPLFYVMTIYVAAAHLFTAENVPGRKDGAFKLWGSQTYGGYTDDSDIRLIVLHAGFVTLEEMDVAKRNGKKDLKVRFKVGREARGRYVGTYPEKGSATATTAAAGGKLELRSYAWGNSHDGGSLEVIGCEWVKKGTAHSLHVPNRKARLAQQTKLRARMGMLPAPTPSTSSAPVTKSALGLNFGTQQQQGSSSPVSETGTLVVVATSPTEPRKSGDVPEDEETRREVEEIGKWTVMFGYGGESGGVTTLGDEEDVNGWFVYDSDLVGGVVWRKEKAFVDVVNEEGRAVKRRKIDEGGEKDKESKKVGSGVVVLENRDERYSLVPVDSSKDDPSSLTYTLYSKSKSKSKPSKSDPPATASDADPKLGRVLASRLTSKDIKFVKDGMYVWLDVDTAPPGSEEVLRSAGTGEMEVDADVDKEKRRPGWFCRVSRWRCETA